jgi:hypothetical protein
VEEKGNQVLLLCALSRINTDEFDKAAYQSIVVAGVHLAKFFTKKQSRFYSDGISIWREN